MAGNVYVFNGTPNTMALILNNTILSLSLAGVQQSSNYVPQQIIVARNPATNSNNATFGTDNTLIVSFSSGGGGSQTYSVDIDPNIIPITNDVQLYIFFNEVVIVSPTGQANQNGQSQLVTGLALSEPQQQEVDAMLAS